MLLANEGEVKFATRDRTPTNEDNMRYYSESFNSEYTVVDENADIVLDIPVGAQIVQIEKEIKPLPGYGYSYNSTTRLLVIDDEFKPMAGETLFIIYKQIMTS